ncbi:MAG: hypothetical protein ACPHHR_02405 [Cycloclasticus sp.]
MLATILIIGIAVCGFFQITPWILIPAAIIAAFLGMHSPPRRAEIAKRDNAYWQALFMSMPLQAILLAVLFGIGWGISLIFH